MRSAHPRLVLIPQPQAPHFSLSSLAFFFNFPATARPLSPVPQTSLFPPWPERHITSLLTPTPATSSSGSGDRKCTRSNSPAPSSATNATCSSATRATSLDLLALRTPNLIPSPSFSLQLSKLARTASMSRCLKDSNVDGFVEDVVNGKPWASGLQEVLAGSHVFVCAHVSRGRGCGVCGLN